MNPLRVLFVIPGEAQGHSMIFARRQALSLTQQGIDVECFYLRSRTSPVALAREYFRLRAHIARFQPALVHAQFGTVTAMLAALAAGHRPLAITYRGGDLNPSPSIQPPRSLWQTSSESENDRPETCSTTADPITINRRFAALWNRSPTCPRVLTRAVRAWVGHFLSQLASLRAGLVVCVSEGLRQRLWWRRDRAVVLPSGVDLELFRPEARDQARARLGWPQHRRVVLFNAGGDPEIKRLDLALAAAGWARRRWPDLHLEILDGRVDPSRVPALMNASDCLLVTSDTEGSPSVIQEALACALPIVSVDVGDACERLRGVSPARVVKREAEALGRALAEVTAEPLRSNGPEAVRELTFDCLARRLCHLYHDALEAAARPTPATALSREREGR
jgi:teichuronic acid biosynthesis glycosyltransferase TuaC